MKAIVCVGESLAVRDAGDAEGFVCDQVRTALRRPFRRRSSSVHHCL
ncbi:MAG: triose-phosphate isomerase [Slackia sp.]